MTRVKHNEKAWRELRKSAPVHDDLLRRAVRAKEAADAWMGVPGSFKVVKEPGKNRARYTVRPATFKALRRVAARPADFAAVCLQAAKG